MNVALDLFTVVAVTAGRVLLSRGHRGLLRFPDTLTRLHALTKADNLGLGLVVLGLLPQVGSVMAGLKLIVVWLLVLLASGAPFPAHRARWPGAEDSTRMTDALNARRWRC